jgi:hypothetical protein
LATGAQQVEADEEGTLSFTMNEEQIRVVILNKEDMLEGNKIIKNILYAASLRRSATLLYLAAPRLLSPNLDAQIFRTHGIGLIVFDDRLIGNRCRGKHPRTNPNTRARYRRRFIVGDLRPQIFVLANGENPRAIARASRNAD